MGREGQRARLGQRVLVVEGDPVERVRLRDLLRRQAYAVTAVADHEAMCRALFLGSFRVLIYGGSLPELRDDSLVASMRDLLPSPPTVLVHSHLPSPDLEDLVRISGAAGGLRRDQPVVDLLVAVEEALEGRRRAPVTRALPSFSPAAAWSTPLPGSETHSRPHRPPADSPPTSPGRAVELPRDTLDWSGLPALPRLLVVDHLGLRRGLLAGWLAARGFHARLVPDADEAFDHLLAADPRPALVLSEVDLPGRSGLDLALRVRREPRLVAVPVLLFTATAAKAARARAARGSPGIHSAFLRGVLAFREVPAALFQRAEALAGAAGAP